MSIQVMLRGAYLTPPLRRRERVSSPLNVMSCIDWTERRGREGVGIGNGKSTFGLVRVHDMYLLKPSSSYKGLPRNNYS